MKVIVETTDPGFAAHLIELVHGWKTPVMPDSTVMRGGPIGERAWSALGRRRSVSLDGPAETCVVSLHPSAGPAGFFRAR